VEYAIALFTLEESAASIDTYRQWGNSPVPQLKQCFASCGDFLTLSVTKPGIVAYIQVYVVGTPIEGEEVRYDRRE
jgi:hypothetical protein